MEVEPTSSMDLAQYARGALVKADALGVVPVPLDDVAAALKLGDPADLFALGDLPDGLRERIARLKDKVLGALDVHEHVIYLDRTLPVERQRFHHGHEIGHYALPSHAEAYYGDDRYTLDPDTVELLEAEATGFGVELVFGVDYFRDQAANYRLGLGAPLELAEIWGLSRTATIRRYVETNPRSCALLVIGRHPGQGRVRILKMLASPSFRARHGDLHDRLPEWLPVDGFELAAAAHKLLLEGANEPILAGQLKIPDGPLLRYELTSNSYRLFALVYEQPRLSVGRRVRPIWTPKSAAQ